jgi:hypothetical protein
MTARQRIAAYALALVAAFGAGSAVGAVVGPIDVGGDEPTVVHEGGGSH